MIFTLKKDHEKSEKYIRSDKNKNYCKFAEMANTNEKISNFQRLKTHSSSVEKNGAPNTQPSILYAKQWKLTLICAHRVYCP